MTKQNTVTYVPEEPETVAKPMSPLMLDRARRVLTELTTGRSETYTEAYRKVVDCSRKNDNTVRNEASRLVNHPDVVSLLKASKTKIAFNKARQKIYTSKHVHERLMWEADPDNNDSASVRVKALELLGKDSGMFQGEAASDDPNTYESTIAKLESFIGSDPEDFAEDLVQLTEGGE